jgi:hypothetical protein
MYKRWLNHLKAITKLFTLFLMCDKHCYIQNFAVVVVIGTHGYAESVRSLSTVFTPISSDQKHILESPQVQQNGSTISFHPDDFIAAIPQTCT